MSDQPDPSGVVTTATREKAKCSTSSVSPPDKDLERFDKMGMQYYTAGGSTMHVAKMQQMMANYTHHLWDAASVAFKKADKDAFMELVQEVMEASRHLLRSSFDLVDAALRWLCRRECPSGDRHGIRIQGLSLICRQR